MRIPEMFEQVSVLHKLPKNQEEMDVIEKHTDQANEDKTRRTSYEVVRDKNNIDIGIIATHYRFLPIQELDEILIQVLEEYKEAYTTLQKLKREHKTLSNIIEIVQFKDL